MATTSPYDGAVGTSPDVPADTESLTFARSIRPPGMPQRGKGVHILVRMGRRLRAIHPWAAPALASMLAGFTGIFVYFVTHPLPGGKRRELQLLPPWDDEAWFIAGSFLSCAVAMFIIVGRLRREAPQP